MQLTTTKFLELTKTHLNWDIRRQRFTIAFILALIAVRTVNLTEIAVHMGGIKKKPAYRKIQRFFQHFRVSNQAFLKFLLTLLPNEPLVLVMDRTNWDYGKVHINFLVLGVLYQSTVIPLCWLVLPKKGNSNQTERIALFDFLLRFIPISRIKVFIADREFIGRDWLVYLKSRGVKRCIRMKKSSLILPNVKARSLKDLFACLKLGESRFLRRRYKISGEWLYLAAVKLEDDLLIVACDDKPRSGLKAYGLRWGSDHARRCILWSRIETFFGNSKTRARTARQVLSCEQEGFHFEATLLARCILGSRGHAFDAEEEVVFADGHDCACDVVGFTGG